MQQFVKRALQVLARVYWFFVSLSIFFIMFAIAASVGTKYDATTYVTFVTDTRLKLLVVVSLLAPFAGISTFVMYRYPVFVRGLLDVLFGITFLCMIGLMLFLAVKIWPYL